MRLAVYADLVYRRDHDRLTSSTPFVQWLGALGEHVSELVVFGRLDPRPGASDFELAGPNLRLVPLPYYPRLGLRAVTRGFLGAEATFRREIVRCDAALLFGPHPNAAVFGWLATRARVPVVVGVRQDFAEYLTHRTSGWRRRLAPSVAHLLEASHRHLARRGGAVVVGADMAERYRTNGARVLETGISLLRSDDLAPLAEVQARAWPGARRLVAAGRLDPEKNPLLLVDIASVVRRLGSWRIAVAGTGSMADRLAAEVESRNLGDVVELHGRLDRDRLFDLYRRSTALLHVSLTEGQPQVLYEAGALGLPIIATAVGGVPTALEHGERGVLVPPDDAEAVVTALEGLDANPEQRRARVEAAWKWASAETMDTQTSRVVRFVCEVASRSE